MNTRITVQEAAERVKALVPEITEWKYTPPEFRDWTVFGARLSFYLANVPGLHEFMQPLSSGMDFDGYVSEDGVEGVADSIRRVIEQRKATA